MTVRDRGYCALVQIGSYSLPERETLTMTTYGEIAEMITPEGEELFYSMIDAHLAAAGAPHRYWLGHLMQDGYRLMFVGDETLWPQRPVDRSALEDLIGWGLIRRRPAGRDPHFDIPAQSIRFHRFLRSQRGQPVDTVERSARNFVEGAFFAQRHPLAAGHLTKAFELLWSDSLDHKTVSELGGHLRSALIEVVTALAGPSKDPEAVNARLRDWLAAQESLEDRSAAALVEYVNAVQHVNQRLTHIRDEEGKGRPTVQWSELRRACFMSSGCCYELGQL